MLLPWVPLFYAFSLFLKNLSIFILILKLYLYTILKENKNECINVYSEDIPVCHIYHYFNDSLEQGENKTNLQLPATPKVINPKGDKSTCPSIIHGRGSVTELFCNTIHSATLLF